MEAKRDPLTYCLLPRTTRQGLVWDEIELLANEPPDQFIRTVAMPPCNAAKEFRNGVRKRWGAVATCQ